MSQFTTPFRGELVGKNLWKNIEPFKYHVGSLQNDEIITVPVGFETNFASVPRIFWPILSPIDNHGKAAVIHDYCYAKGLYTRRISDKIFREGMRVLKVKPWKIFCMYYSLRMCGWYVWYKYRLREKRERL